MQFFHFSLLATLLLSNSPAFAKKGDFGTEGAVKVGNTKVHFILGDISKQNADAYTVAHWPTGVSEGAAAGAIYNAGAEGGYQQIQKIYADNGGHVPVLSATLTESGGGLSKYLINVASLHGERANYYFTRVEQLDQSKTKFSAEDRAEYRKYLTQMEALKEDQYRERNNLDFHIRKLLKRYEPEMHEELKQVISQAVYNSLVAVEAKPEITTVATPVLGTGIMGDLNFAESFEATLAGLQAYEIAHPEHAMQEFGIVVYGYPNSKNLKWLDKQIAPLVKKGKFLDFKFSDTNPIRPSAEQWESARLSFAEKNPPSESFFANLVGQMRTLCGFLAGGS